MQLNSELHDSYHKELRDKLGVYKSVGNAKWLSLEHRNVAIALGFVEMQLHSV